MSNRPNKGLTSSVSCSGFCRKLGMKVLKKTKFSSPPLRRVKLLSSLKSKNFATRPHVDQDRSKTAADETEMYDKVLLCTSCNPNLNNNITQETSKEKKELMQNESPADLKGLLTQRQGCGEQ
ncbi:hypothetical protein LguiA_020936 [Lonicera macranthoides]